MPWSMHALAIQICRLEALDMARMKFVAIKFEGTHSKCDAEAQHVTEHRRAKTGGKGHLCVP